MTARRAVDLSREELAVLGRELLLAGHLIDRASMPHILGRWGREAMGELAIEEWMGASPVYTRRIQQLLAFHGSDVETIFKGMQFDIGAPHQFLDFRYRVHDADHGEFWLDHCGALMDVEPMGDELVVTMCHDIEDPTFDATACATNRRAKVRPIHRPPRVPAGREPHCHWTVTIDHDAEPVPDPPHAAEVAATRAAQVPIPSATPPAAPFEGRTDYSGPLDPDLRLEQFAPHTLLAIADEVCLQGHLLSQSGLLAIAARSGEAVATEIGRQQLTGVAGVVATRLLRAFGTGDTVDDLATVLELHPAFRPRSYVGLTVEPAPGRDDSVLSLHLGPCPALDEPSGLSWTELLVGGDEAPLDAIVTAVDPGARCARRARPALAGGASWDVRLGAEPAEVAVEVTLTRFSTGADFVLR